MTRRMERTYKRDKRSPVPSSESASRLMSAIKGKDTSPEIVLRRELRRQGLCGYRVHMKDAPGRPDIAYKGQKVAIFVHGCFWHRCPKCSPHSPKANSEYWEAKFTRNVERDERKRLELESEGWAVLVIWEHGIKENPWMCVNRIEGLLIRRGREPTHLVGHSS